MEKRGLILFIIAMILLVGGMYFFSEGSSMQGSVIITGQVVGVERDENGYKIYAEESPGSTTPIGVTAIDIDSLNQPHILTDSHPSNNMPINYYYKIGENWNKRERLVVKSGGPKNPTIRIDANDRAWISALTFVSGNIPLSTSWVGLINNVATSPSGLVWFNKITPYTGYVGNLDIDPNKPNQAIHVRGQRDAFTIFDQNGGQQSGLSFGLSQDAGEGTAFRISPNQNGEQPGIWHYMSVYDYQNQRRYEQGLQYIPWINRAVPPFHQEKNYPGLGIDIENPEIAYFALWAGSRGLIINIWNGNGLVFPNNGQVVGPSVYGGNGNAFAARWAPVPGGGAFLCWTGSDNRIKIRYIGSEGTMGDTLDVSAGSGCSITTSLSGDIHIAYNNGGLRYRKIETPYGCDEGEKRNENTFCLNTKMFDESGNWQVNAVGSCRFGTKEETCGSRGWEWSECTMGKIGENDERCNGMDDDCDGVVDEGCDDDQDGYVDATKSCGGLFHVQYGWITAIPTSGDFDGDGIDDLTIYCGDCAGGTDWWIRYSSNGTNIQKDHGFANAIPAPGDFDGDGRDDVAVYDPADRKWYVSYSSGQPAQGQPNLNNYQWGFGNQPAPADYDGDGIDDLAIYCGDCGEGGKDWWIQYSSDGSQQQKEFGWQASLPVPSDYDGDGIDDLAVWNPVNGNWIIQQSRDGFVTRQFGGPNVEPVPGDYDGDGRTDLAVRTPEGSILTINYGDSSQIAQCRDEQGNINNSCHGCSEKDLDDNNILITTSYPCIEDNDCTDDDNDCTDDRCVGNVCVYQANTNTCNDGLFCTADDRCGNKTCSGVSKICQDDALACTIPYCDETQDSCLFSFENCVCESDNECPDDENTCTDIQCINRICEQVSNTNICDDHNACTDNDICSNSTCLGIPKQINDNDPGTYDVCIDGVVSHEIFEAGRIYDFEYEYEDIYGIGDEVVVVSNQTGVGAEGDEEEKSNAWIWIVVIVVIIIIGVVYLIKKKGLKFWKKTNPSTSHARALVRR